MGDPVREVVVITGGRNRTPTLAEFERFDLLLFGGDDDPGLGARFIREGEAKGTDKACAAYLRARHPHVTVEKWPADWGQHGRAAGPIRNRGMISGAHPDGQRPPAGAVVSFDGGAGTADCRRAGFEAGLAVLRIHAVEEPRPWNRHHGDPMIRKPDGSTVKMPALYCGRGTPVGNPFTLDLRGRSRIEAAPEAMEKYRRWLWARISQKSPDFDQAVVDYIRQLTPDHYATCSCWPSHCHVEIVIAAWRWLTASA